MPTRAITIVLLSLALAACGNGNTDPGTSTTATPTTTTTTGPIATTTSTTEPAFTWPADLPGWAARGVAYLDAYREALGGGDIAAVFPFFDEDVAWWDDLTPEARLRVGLRDTLTRLIAAPQPAVRQPGMLFVGWAQLPDDTYAVLHWPHAVGDVAQNLHLVLAGDGVSRHRATGHVATAIGGAHPDAIARASGWYGEIARRFSSGDATDIASMFTDRTVYVANAKGILEPVNPRLQFEAWMSDLVSEFPDMTLRPLTLADIGLITSEPALFFTPSVAAPWWQGEDVGGGTGYYAFQSSPADTAIRVAVDWIDVDGDLVALDFYFDATGIEALGEATPPEIGDAWPAVPGPTRARTASVQVGNETIELYNATPDHIELVRWALDQFGSAGLDVPIPNSIGFPPDVSCVLYAGLTTHSDEGVDLQLCFDAEELCTGDDCAPSTTARSTLLHELGHVWTSQNLNDTTQSRFLNERGLDEWRGQGLTRDESGTEHAAEILAWGLLDADAWDARLPDNSCAELTAAFRVLTGVDPLRSCG